MGGEPIAIIGGGLAAAKAATTLRGKGFDGDLVVVAGEPQTPYERPKLTKEYFRREAPRDAIYPKPREWYDEAGVDLRLGSPAVDLDPRARVVTLADGSRIGYSRLLLATGSTPRPAGIPGTDLENVVGLRTLEDSDLLHALVLDAVRFRDGRLVIVGDGWIGLEIAASARQLGAEVTVVGRGVTPLARPLGERMGGYYAALHARNGVVLRSATTPRRILGRDGRAVGVELSDGTVVAADVVLTATGVTPNVGLAVAAGLALRDSALGGGIAVDATLRTSAPDIYAAGDVASIPSPVFGTPVRVDHWATALRTGPHAARAMLGDPAPYERLPYFYSDQYDTSMEYTGLGAGTTEVRVTGSTDDSRFVAYWTREGRVVAGMSVNIPERMAAIEELITSRRPLADADLAVAA